MFKTKKSIIIFSLFVVSFLFISLTNDTNAGIIDDLKGKISGRSSEIQKLEKEIEEYQEQLKEIGQEKQTLQKEVKTIDITRQKLSTDIRVTENKVKASSLTIEKLNIEIQEKERDISQNIEVVKNALRTMNKIEDDSLVEMVLASDDLSKFWDDIENLRSFQTKINDDIKELQVLKKELEKNRAEREEEKGNLITYKSRLSDQKQIADSEKKKKNSLLTVTKNKESSYQVLLKEKQAQKKAFEEELARIESELRYELDPNKIPSAGSGVLLWPLAGSRNESCYSGGKTAINCITQYFGNTQFAKSAAYNGQGHNGIDFRASVGTEIRAALSGIVKEINIKSAPGCQYGKWILIKHGNGLSTLYTHLSLVRVDVGDTVLTGDKIGYSGDTGYATGPHLHFTVYASNAISFRNYTCKSGVTVSIPVAAYNAYLNPLDYL